MRQRIELTAAVAAAALNIMVTASLLSILYSSYIAGMEVPHGTPPDVNGAQHELGIATLLFIGVALGSYLHVIQGQLVGLVLLVGSAASLIAGTVYMLVAPGALVQMWLFIYVAVPSWLPPAVGLALVLSTVSAGAAVAPGLSPHEETAASRIESPAPGPSS